MNSKVEVIGNTNVTIYIPSITKEEIDIDSTLIDVAAQKARNCLSDLFKGATSDLDITGAFKHKVVKLQHRIIHERNKLIIAASNSGYLNEENEKKIIKLFIVPSLPDIYSLLIVVCVRCV